MKRSNVKKARMEQSRRPKKNPLKAAGIEKVDYKDINTLRLFISDRHKIRSRRVTGLTPQQQLSCRSPAAKPTGDTTRYPMVGQQPWDLR